MNFAYLFIRLRLCPFTSASIWSRPVDLDQICELLLRAWNPALFVLVASTTDSVVSQLKGLILALRLLFLHSILFFFLRGHSQKSICTLTLWCPWHLMKSFEETTEQLACVRRLDTYLQYQLLKNESSDYRRLFTSLISFPAACKSLRTLKG